METDPPPAGASETSSLAEAIFDTVREPLLVLDSNLCVLQASASFYSHFQAAPAETVGRPVYDLGNGQWNIQELRHLLEEVLPKSKTFDGYDVEHDFQRIGRQILRLNARRIDHLGLILLAMENVTEQRAAEEALQHSEQRYRRLFETAKDGILILDAESGAVTEANPFIAELLGQSVNFFLDKHLWDLGLLSDVASSKRAFAELQEKDYLRYEDLPLVKKDGQTINVEFVCNLYDCGDRKVIQCNIRDISYRKTIERLREQARVQIEALNAELSARAKELENSNKELEAFDFTVAHDLRQPLNTIGLYCQTIKRQLGDALQRECDEAVQQIHKLTKQMDGLIEALLRFSRAGHGELRREKVDLSQLARDAAEELRLSDTSRRVRVEISDGMVVVGDNNLLRILISNLLSNAWKYTAIRDEAVIRFGTREVADEPAYFVEDNGIGIAMTDAEDVFTPFHRLPGTEAYRGHGIGLATVARIVQRHNGRVWAEGEPGKGTVFWFTLGDTATP